MEIYNYTVNVVSLSSNVHYGVKNYNINIETRVKILYHAHIHVYVHECLHKYVVYVKMPTRAL